MKLFEATSVLDFFLHFLATAAIQTAVGWGCFKHFQTAIIWAAIAGFLVATVNALNLTIFDGRGLEMPIVITFLSISAAWRFLTRFITM